MLGEIVERGANSTAERALACPTHPFDARADPTARLGNFFITRARDTLFEIHKAWPSKYRMGVGIDESRQYNLSATIDLRDLLAILSQPRISQRIFRRTNRNNLAAKA